MVTPPPPNTHILFVLKMTVEELASAVISWEIACVQEWDEAWLWVCGKQNRVNVHLMKT